MLRVFCDMKKLTFISIVLLASCSQKDEAFCNCISVADDFEKESAAILNGEKEVDEKVFRKLKQEKEMACKDYLTMSGEVMLKKKETCE